MPPSQSPKSIEQQTVDHYNNYNEAERLKSDIGPLELVRTQELITRYLAPPPKVVVDGRRRHGRVFALAGEPGLQRSSDRHRAEAHRTGPAGIGGALIPETRRRPRRRRRNLPLADEFADAIIMHGPLYHLTDRSDRLRAIAEARRVLRPGGLLLAFAITRYAGLIHGLRCGYVFDAAYQRMTGTEVRTGLRENPPEWLSTFPKAFFHLPDELGAEVREGGLIHEATLGILGPAWMVPDLDASWKDKAHREVILEIARMTENEPLLGPRLMAVGRKAV